MYEKKIAIPSQVIKFWYLFYFQEKLQQLVILRSPDVVTIAREPESGK